MAQGQIQVQKQEQTLRQTQTITQQQMLQAHLVELPINQLIERINTEMDDNPALEAEWVSPELKAKVDEQIAAFKASAGVLSDWASVDYSTL